VHEASRGFGQVVACSKCRAGFFGSSAPLPALDGAPGVRAFQLAQLKVKLPWAARELGLPAPDSLSEVH
jgi:hypothetical protein